MFECYSKGHSSASFVSNQTQKSSLWASQQIELMWSLLGTVSAEIRRPFEANDSHNEGPGQTEPQQAEQALRDSHQPGAENTHELAY